MADNKTVTTRDPFLDNARAILITLVVIGHVLNSADSYLGGALETWIYAFHMPAFVAISGYLSRSYRNEPRQISRILSALLVPYLILQGLHATLRVIIKGDDFSLDLWEPSWTLWFLLALFIWRLTAPIFKILRFPVIFAVVISIVTPLEPDLDQTMSWGRVLSFLPFFVLGLMTRPEHLERLRAFRFKFLGYLVLGGGLVLSFFSHDLFRVSIFHMSTSYAEHDSGNLAGVFGRILVLTVGIVALISVLLITPQRRYWWTDIGKNSLTVYLLHGMILLPMRYSDFLEEQGNGGTAVAVVAAVALTLVLSRSWVVKATAWVTNPPVEPWLVPRGTTKHPSTPDPKPGPETAPPATQAPE